MKRSRFSEVQIIHCPAGAWQSHAAERGAMKTKGYNQRRACALAGIDPRVYRRASKRPADTALRIRMKELASERRRFGYPLPGRALRSSVPRGGACTSCCSVRDGR